MDRNEILEGSQKATNEEIVSKYRRYKQSSKDEEEKAFMNN